MKPPAALPKLKYNADGLVPAIVQQHDSGEVLMVVYMNEGAILLTLHTGTLWFWSRSRGTYWNKGAKNDNPKTVIDMSYDCVAGAVLVAVEAVGANCHTNNRSCFFRSFYRTERDRDPNPALIAPTLPVSNGHAEDPDLAAADFAS
jgi:phosphoribosyl-AMP cyclohydrolase